MEMPCPKCGRPLPVSAGYVNWCSGCGWGLSAPQIEERGRLDEALDVLGGRLAAGLTADADRQERPGISAWPARAGAVLIALFVHLTTALVATAAVLLMVLGFPNPFFLLIGLLLLLVALLMRPRLGRVPTDGLVPSDDAPQLHGLVAEVAAAAGTRAPDRLRVDAEPGFRLERLGIARHRILTLGLPTWALLEPQERVAQVGYELGREAAGDPGARLVTGTAVQTLTELVLLGEPDLHSPPGRGDRRRASQGSLRLLLQPVRLLLALQLRLLMPSRRRAEYAADQIGARAGGAGVMIGAHEKLMMDWVLDDELRRSLRGGSMGLLSRWRDAVLDVPEHELERRRRAARLDSARLGATHPTTPARIEALEQLPPSEPEVVLDGERDAAVEEELTPHRDVIEERLLDDYRAKLL